MFSEDKFFALDKGSIFFGENGIARFFGSNSIESPVANENFGIILIKLHYFNVKLLLPILRLLYTRSIIILLLQNPKIMAGINTILKIFLPKDRIFYQLFESVSEVLVKMGDKLKDVVNEPDFDKRGQLIQEIEDMEHVNDDLTHTIFTELGKNFITPFDREDIHYLATALDDIADYIYASAKKINFYRVNPNDMGFNKMADLIALGCRQVEIAVKELRNMKNMRLITDALVSINSIENQADDIFDMSIERLFATEPDAKEVIKKREIYQVMEIVTDKCEDAANVIESIIVKYA